MSTNTISISEIANLSAAKLLDYALFKFAYELWLTKLHEDDLMFRVSCWRERITCVTEYFLEHYQETPTVIQRQIINVIRIIGKELSDFLSDGLKTRRRLGNPDLQIDEFCWTSHFTIDRVKTSMLLCKETRHVEGYVCPSWVKSKWDLETPTTKSVIRDFFGKYSIIVYIHCTMYVGCHLKDFERYLRICSRYFVTDTHEERTLTFFILNGNIECLDYFRNKIPSEKHRAIILRMIEAIIEDSHLVQLRLSQHVYAQTVVFLWNYLDQEDRCLIVQKHFSAFYRFLLSSPGTESLVSAIEWYKPLIDGTRDNCRYLESTALKMTSDLCEGQRYRCMFRNLYKSVRISLSTIDILNLLEVLLTIDDIEMASMMVRMMEEDKRSELLDVIPEVWNDLWTATICRETFFAFFFEVQSHIFRTAMRNNN